MPPPGRNNRRAELDAAFDADAEELPIAARPTTIPTSISHLERPPGYEAATSTSNNSNSHDVFFDAGDALPEEPPQPQRQRSVTSDPLGASGPGGESDDDDDEDGDDDTANILRSTTTSSSSRRPATTPNGGYDFERASYFNTSRSRSGSNAGHSPSGSPGHSGDASTSRAVGSSSSSSAAAAAASSNAPTLARARLMLGRFGRFVGMRVPGAAYSTLAQDDGSGSGGPSGSSGRPRRVIGGGLSQDGVFGNLNAKPESRRRRRNGDPNDRGEDDDLEEDTLPPTYEVAAADAAPGYWETTIAPGGMGWTPGGGHVGDVEDLILEGLPIGNFFGFAWNLLVSMCFQFVGFLLTYLLHTTHAARCGSRAGLGITLIQYGFYLRTRAVQLTEDGGAGGVGGGMGDGEPQTLAWWGGTIVYPGAPASSSAMATPSARSALWDQPASPAATQPASALAAAAASVTSSAMSAASTTNLASAFAAEGDGLPANTTTGGDGSMGGTSEWLAYALMVIGWFLLLSSVLSYWRVHRWGRALVAASRREQESARAAENGGEAPETSESMASPPVGFLHRLRAIMEQQQQLRNSPPSGRSTGTGEDWVIFPGMRGAGSRAANGGANAEDSTGRSGSSSNINTASSGHGLTIWGAAPRLGNLAFPVHDERPRGHHDEEDDDDEDELARLTSNGGDDRAGEAHLSPEERRMLRGLRGAGLM